MGPLREFRYELTQGGTLAPLVRLRVERPHDSPAVLALALDPGGTGQPMGREVRETLEQVLR